MTQNATHMKAVERQGYRAGHRPHIVMINRWQERYAEYGRYLDHKRYQVSYVTTAVGLASVPPVAGATVLVDATDDLVAVRAAVRDLAVRYGAPAAVVALKEDDLLVGAELRQEWQCPGGPRPHDLLVFRDKGAMCQAIHAGRTGGPRVRRGPRCRCRARLRRRPRLAGDRETTNRQLQRRSATAGGAGGPCRGVL